MEKEVLRVPTEPDRTASRKRKATDDDNVDDIPLAPRNTKRLKDKAGRTTTSIPKATSSLMNIEAEVRLEILRNLLLLERNQYAVHEPGELAVSDFLTLAKDPHALRNTYHSIPTRRTNHEDDTYLETGLKSEVRYRPSLAILRVCKQLKVEGQEIFHKENHWIGVKNAPTTLLSRLVEFGIQYRVWNTLGAQLMPHPVLSIEFRPATGGQMGASLLCQPSDLRRLALCFLQTSILFDVPHMSHIQRMHIQLFPGKRTLTAFGQKDFAGLIAFLQKGLIDSVGNEVQGSWENGMHTPSLRDRLQGRAALMILPLGPPVEQIHQLIWHMRADFKEAYAVHVNEGFKAAIQGYLDLRTKICIVARYCNRLTVPQQVIRPMNEYHLLCMLSWIAYHIALSIGPPKWIVLFAHRALTLPTYVPEMEWKMRIHVLVAGLLGPWGTLRKLRIFHLARAASSLELRKESLLNRQFCGLQTMATDRNANLKGLDELMGLLQTGLKAKMVRRYGREVAIPEGALDN